MSRYDRPDPGVDPEYCDSLAPEYDEVHQCPWCDEPFEDKDHFPYCSLECGLMADREGE